MKRLKQVVVGLVWCTVSVGCVADNRGDLPIVESTKVTNGFEINSDSEIPYFGIGKDGDYPPIPANYRLAMNKNDKLCSYVAKSLPQIKYNGVCSYCLSGVDIFKGVNWKQTVDKKYSGIAYHTVIDINNDGHMDYVEQSITTLQNSDYHQLWANIGSTIRDPSNNSVTNLGISSIGYPLSGFSEKPEPQSLDYAISYDRYYIIPKSQTPFIFLDKTYIFMDTDTHIKTGPMRKKWIVISQYISGDFSGSYRTGVFEDQCYFEIIFTQPYSAPVKKGESK